MFVSTPPYQSTHGSSERGSSYSPLFAQTSRAEGYRYAPEQVVHKIEAPAMTDFNMQNTTHQTQMSGATYPSSIAEAPAPKYSTSQRSFPSPTFPSSLAQANDFSSMSAPRYLSIIPTTRDPALDIPIAPPTTSPLEDFSGMQQHIPAASPSNPFQDRYFPTGLTPTSANGYWSGWGDNNIDLKLKDEVKDLWAAYPSLSTYPRSGFATYPETTIAAPQPALTLTQEQTFNEVTHKSKFDHDHLKVEQDMETLSSTRTCSGSPLSSSGISLSTRPRRPQKKPRTKTTPENAKFDCHICGMLTRRKYNLRVHMDTHNPERKYPYPCSFKNCDKRFGRKADLRRHYKAVHLGLREFSCDSCEQKFSRPDALKRHLEDYCHNAYSEDFQSAPDMADAYAMHAERSYQMHLH